MCNASINVICYVKYCVTRPEIPRARVVDAKQTRSSPVLGRVWLRETSPGRYGPSYNLKKIIIIMYTYSSHDFRYDGVVGLNVPPNNYVPPDILL